MLSIHTSLGLVHRHLPYSEDLALVAVLAADRSAKRARFRDLYYGSRYVESLRVKWVSFFPP